MSVTPKNKAVFRYLITGVVIFLLNACQEDLTPAPEYTPPERRTEVLVSNPVFAVSYNEVFEQPNWLEYVVLNVPKNFDRGTLDFYEEKDIHTSNDDDYYANVWDKGHLAPAATFSDTYERLYQTFSFLNCALQYDDLNRGEWAQLEAQEREWVKTYEELQVRIELVFEDNHQILPTGAHVPTGFVKRITFPQDSTVCYYFENVSPEKVWEESRVVCE